MKKSSRGYILHQLNLFKNTLDERIKKSKIDDADKFMRDNQPIKKEENTVNEDGPNTSRRTKRPKQIRLLSIADSSDESSTEEFQMYSKRTVNPSKMAHMEKMKMRMTLRCKSS